ncbi:MAG: hypothetical protein K6U00_04220 [Armatimonadetes bacterium]|nr:hypothetical protein [Armatimonadota bacterium]
MSRLLRDSLSVMRELFFPLMMVTCPLALLINRSLEGTYNQMSAVGLSRSVIMYACSALLIAGAGAVRLTETPLSRRIASTLGTTLVLVVAQGLTWIGSSAADRLEISDVFLSTGLRIALIPLALFQVVIILAPAISLVHGYHPVACMRASAVAIFGNADRFGALLFVYVLNSILWQLIPGGPGGRDPVVVTVLGGLLDLLPASLAGLVVVRLNGKAYSQVRLQALPPSVINMSSTVVAALLGALIYALLTSLMPVAWPLPLSVYYHLVFRAPSTVLEAVGSLLCGMGAGWIAARTTGLFMSAPLAGLVFGVVILTRPWFLYKSDVILMSRLVLPYAAYIGLFLLASSAGGLLARRRAHAAMNQNQ